jgi:superfamily II DNA/RNA helicase
MLGKTAAYSIPIVQNLLSWQNEGNNAIKVVILVPTKELCEQTAQHFKQLTQYCSK